MTRRVCLSYKIGLLTRQGQTNKNVVFSNRCAQVPIRDIKKIIEKRENTVVNIHLYPLNV